MDRAGWIFGGVVDVLKWVVVSEGGEWRVA